PLPGLLLGGGRKPPEAARTRGKVARCDRLLPTFEPRVRQDPAVRSLEGARRPSRLQLRHVVRLLPDGVRAPRTADRGAPPARLRVVTAALRLRLFGRQRTTTARQG